MMNNYQIDGRDYQILFLSSFLGMGIYLRDWSFDPLTFPLLWFTCVAFQAFLSWCYGEFRFNWKSPMITSLGIALLLRSNHLSVLLLAGILAIGSKFWFRDHHKHWFNPANFGIVVTLLLTGDAWVSPGQWGQDLWFGLVFLGLGGIVLKQVGRIDTSIGFLASYGSLLAIKDLYLGWTWDVFGHQMMSGSLLLFALFMITDPRSIPNARTTRILWSMGIGVLGFILQFQFYLTPGIFYSLFVMSMLTVWLDRWFVAPKFEWRLSPLKFSALTILSR